VARRTEVKVRITGESKNLEQATKRAENRLGALRDKTDKLEAEFKSGQISAEKYARAMEEITRESNQLETSTKKVKAQSAKLEAEFKAGRISAEKYAKSLVKMRAESAKLGTTTQSLGAKMKQNWLAITAAVTGAVIAITGLIRITGSAVSAHIEHEKSIRKMNASLQSTGEFSQAASRDMQTFAKALATVNATSDEAVLSGIALAKSFGQSNEEAKRMVATAFDFAIAADLNFTEALRRMGRAAHGSTEDVAKFAPEIANLTKEQLRAGGATLELEKRFKGLAAAATTDAEVAISSLKEAVKDLAAGYGALIARSGEASGVTSGLTILLDALTPSTDSVVVATKRLSEIQVNLAASVHSVTQQLKEELEAQGRTPASINAMLASFRTLVSGLGSTKDAWEALVRAEERALRIQDSFAASAAEFKSFLGEIGTALDKDVNEKIDEYTRHLEFARRNQDALKLSSEDLARIERDTAAAIGELVGSLSPATTQVDALSGAYDRAAQASDRFTLGIRQNTAALAENAVAGASVNAVTGDQSSFAQISGGTFTTWTSGDVQQDAQGGLYASVTLPTRAFDPYRPKFRTLGPQLPAHVTGRRVYT
jgi:chromosome segregation ATPase